MFTATIRRHLQTVAGRVFHQTINWNRAWHVIYGWKDLVGNKFWDCIQSIVYENIRVQNTNNHLYYTEMEVHEAALYVFIHTYIYQVGAFKSTLLVRLWDNWPITFPLWVIMQVLPCWGYLYYHAANMNHQLCSVLTNNRYFKGPTW